jgi:light-regulated signal transduction histidine kinase (bacteriophytochrome)
VRSLPRSGAIGEGASVSVEEGLTAEGDEELLEVLLTILLENACKYHGPEPASIRMGKTVVDGESCFFVADDGIGFEMKYVQKLFRPFERLHRDQEYPGTGIGLANAKRIVERQGGRIWAESAGPGKGAAFYFVLD